MFNFCCNILNSTLFHVEQLAGYGLPDIGQLVLIDTGNKDLTF